MGLQGCVQITACSALPGLVSAQPGKSPGCDQDLSYAHSLVGTCHIHEYVPMTYACVNTHIRSMRHIKAMISWESGVGACEAVWKADPAS